MPVTVKDVFGSNINLDSQDVSGNEQMIQRALPYNSDGQELFKPSNLGYVGIAGNSNANLDAFGRFRVSDAVSLFESQLQYNKQPLFFDESLTGGATSTHLPNESSVRMRCGTASGDKVIRQTFQYFRYQAGKSQLIELTGVMGAKKANVRQRIGYFDDENGLFFEQDENNLKVVRRSFASGTAVDNVVLQSAWNIDKLDGTGASGYTLDMSKTQIFLIDLQWLGVGRVRYGFVIDGMIIYCHESLHANNLTEVYMTTANLPVRYELENTGASASQTDMKHICCSVISEGGFVENLAITQSFSNATTEIPITTRRPVITFRPKSTFNSITNRGLVNPIKFNIYTDASSVLYEIVLNGTLSGGTTTFTSVGDDSITEFNTGATSISGGTILDSGYVGATFAFDGVFSSFIENKLALANNIAGDTTQSISVVCTSLGGSTDTACAVTVKEFY